ncbi:MAG: glycosyltransferase [Verrucomicrobiae bacterium]|nr:glycosyltransferase [Verrucomicrobiae bacterium]
MSRRVLHFITELEIGGAERLLVSILPRLDRTKFEPSVVYLHGDDLRPELERAGIRVTRINSKGKFDVAAFSQCVQLLRDEKSDILHTHLIQADLLGFFAARRARVPAIISTKHNTNYFHSHALWLPRVDAFVNRRVTRIIAVSAAVKKHYIEQQQLPAEKIEVIRNGIDLGRFRNAQPIDKTTLGLKPADKLVVCVASLKVKKGHSVLLQAWPHVVAKHRNACLALVGDGPLRDELKRAASPLPFDGTVHFLGNRSDVPAILAAADVFVLPSLWEGFGIAVVEAMAAGVPVVASRVDGVCEIIRDRQDGVLVPPSEPDKLAQAIVELLSDGEWAKQLVDSAHKRAEEFSIQATVERLQALYESVT